MALSFGKGTHVCVNTVRRNHFQLVPLVTNLLGALQTNQSQGVRGAHEFHQLLEMGKDAQLLWGGREGGRDRDQTEDINKAIVKTITNPQRSRSN